MNITQLLMRQAEAQPQALAIRRYDRDFTYAEFAECVLRASTGLERAGVVAGEVVAIALDDPFDHWCATLALAYRGVTAFSLSRTMSNEQVSQLMSRGGCVRVLGDHVGQLSHVMLPENTLKWTDVKTGALPKSTEFAPQHIDHPWLLVNGSGSTGHPKIMPITHRAQWHRASLGRQWLPYGAEDILLSLVSMHFYAAKQRSLEAIAMGAAVFLDTPGRVDHHHEVMAGKVTAIYATVSHVERLLKVVSEAQGMYYEPLRALMVGGSVVGTRLREQICAMLTPRLHVLWGTNESHTATITRLNEVFTTEGAIGRPFPGVKIEIVDQSDEPVARGTDGLIRVQSESLIDGYLGDPEATQKAFRDGWFYPGDIGHFTADGQLVHRGRADDMMIVSGVNVYPAEIEECLRGVAGVEDSLATPLRHPQLQDLPVALVVSAAGVVLDAQALIDHVRDHIGRHTLHDLVFVDSIPRNEQGKVQREEVAKMLRAKWGANKKDVSMNTKGSGVETPHQEGSLNLGFKLPPDAAPEALTAWIALLDCELLAVYGSHQAYGAATEGKRWLRQVLTLASGLLHALRVPFFDQVEIAQCRRVEGQVGGWQAICRLADPVLVPAPVWEGVIKVAFKLAAWAVKADIDSGSKRQYFFRVIEDEVIRGFAKFKPNGKSTFEVLRVAHRTGVPYLALPGGVFQLGWGANARRIDRSTTDRDSCMGMRWAQNKVLAAQVLRQAGLPGPTHHRVSSVDHARQAAQRLGYPVVVKPADLERGEGVSVDVRAEGLALAFNDAMQRSPSKGVLVEQQASGVCHRLFVACGKLLYAVRRLPIGIYADGRSTIRALVAAECEAQQRIPPWKRSGLRPLDDLSMQMLRRQAWVPDSIPEAGKFVALRRIETTAWGGVDEEVTHMIHPDNVRAAIDATRLFGLEVAGVDIISSDITQAWHANGAIINEINYAPLLGGGEISRRYIGEYLSLILEDQGRIPIHIYAGGEDARKNGKAKWGKYCASGIDAYLIDGARILDAKGVSSVMKLDRLDLKVQALLMRESVQALVVVAPSSYEALSVVRFARSSIVKSL